MAWKASHQHPSPEEALDVGGQCEAAHLLQLGLDVPVPLEALQLLLAKAGRIQRPQVLAVCIPGGCADPRQEPILVQHSDESAGTLLAWSCAGGSVWSCWKSASAGAACTAAELRATCRQMGLACGLCRQHTAVSHAYLLVSDNRPHPCSTVRSLQVHETDCWCCRRSPGCAWVVWRLGLKRPSCRMQYHGRSGCTSYAALGVPSPADRAAVPKVTSRFQRYQGLLQN